MTDKPTKEYIREKANILHDLEKVSVMAKAVRSGHWTAMSCAEESKPFQLVSQKASGRFDAFILDLIAELEEEFARDENDKS